MSTSRSYDLRARHRHRQRRSDMYDLCVPESSEPASVEKAPLSYLRAGQLSRSRLLQHVWALSPCWFRPA